MRDVLGVQSSRMHRSCSVPGPGVGCIKPVGHRFSKPGVYSEQRRQHDHPQDAHSELSHMHEELSQLRLEMQMQQEGWQAELSVAHEEQRTLRAEIEDCDRADAEFVALLSYQEQSLSTVELPRLGQAESQQHSWILEEPFLMHPDMEELMAARSELSSLSATHERQKEDWQEQMAGARQELEEALAVQMNHAELQEELGEAKAAAQAQEDLQGRLRCTCNELEEVKVERQDVHEELRRTRVELEALLETRQRQGADLQGELLRMRGELSSLRQRQGQQWELQEELRQSQAERDRLARALREQGQARGELEDEVSRVHALLEATHNSNRQKVQALQDELSRARSALNVVDEDRRREAAALQEELLAVRSELASARASQTRQQPPRPSLHQRPGESPTRPHWAQHPPSLPPPPTRRSLGCQADCQADRPGEAADERSSDDLEELRRVRAERDELAARMQRQEAIQDAILHTCEELEAGYMASKRQHQDLRGELRRVCQERDKALKKLNVDLDSTEDRKSRAELDNFTSQASARGRSAPPAPAPPPYLLVAPPSVLPITVRGGIPSQPGTKGDCGSPALKSLAMTPGREDAPLDMPSSPLNAGGGAVRSGHVHALRHNLSLGAAATAAKAEAAAKAAARVVQEACGEAPPGSLGGHSMGPPAPASWSAAPALEPAGRGGGGIPQALRRLQGLTDELLGPLAALAAAGGAGTGVVEQPGRGGRPETKDLQQQATSVKACAKVAAAAGG